MSQYFEIEINFYILLGRIWIRNNEAFLKKREGNKFFQFERIRKINTRRILWCALNYGQGEGQVKIANTVLSRSFNWRAPCFAAQKIFYKSQLKNALHI